MAGQEQESIPSFTEKIKKSVTDLGSLNAYVQAYEILGAQATNLNQAFTQNRARIVEMQQSIANAIPSITRLGGSVEDVTNTISSIASASNRNVIANTESVEKLFAASKVLSTSVENITDRFADIGVSFENIPSMLEESIYYVQSIGGNAQEVMGQVLSNTEQLNRFQFDGGVKGLTKMAAQASMLRFDMNETFRLADKVLDPDKAVEVASAFQRLGVSAGNLVDPFQLMNQSINDPSGLQTSLADVAKQFTYFDEKTKSFKINPQGVLTLKQMEEQVGLSEGSLSKMGLAAAEVNARLSEVSMAGLKFENEEDKQYLANIAKLGKGGKYEVQLSDGTKKELRELSQDELNNLIDEQKKGPQTLEEITRSQLNLSELVANDVKAIRDKVVYGMSSVGPALSAGEVARGVSDALLGSASARGVGDVETIRKYPEKLFSNIENIITQIKEGKSTPEVLDNFLESNKGMMDLMGKEFKDGFGTYTDKVIGKLSDSNLVDKKIKETLSSFKSETSDNKMSLKGSKPGQSLIEGVAPLENKLAGGKDVSVKDMKINHNFDKVVVQIDVPAELKGSGSQTLNQILDQSFNSQRFRQYIEGLFNSMSQAQTISTKTPTY